MNDKIILYADNQLNAEEKKQFEKEIQNSPQLKKELDVYLQLLNEINELKNVPLQEDYFIQIVPKFRAVLAKKEVSFKKPILATAFSVIAFFLGFIFFYNISQNYNTTNINLQFSQNQIQQLDDEELSQYIDDYSGNYSNINIPKDHLAYYDSLFDNIIYSEIDSTSINNYMANSDINYNRLYESLNSTETEKIYNEIINKKFF